MRMLHLVLEQVVIQNLLQNMEQVIIGHQVLEQQMVVILQEIQKI